MKTEVEFIPGDTKLDADSHHGTIVKICLPDGSDHPERGFGYISTCDGREVYFQADSLLEIEFQRLELGSEVNFAEEQGDDGPHASSVWIDGQ